MNPDHFGITIEAEARKGLDGLCQGSRKQQCLAPFRQIIDDGVHGFLETHVEHSIGLVQN